MRIRVRFFARFREIFGPEILADVEGGTSITGLIRSITQENPEGRDAIFTKDGEFLRYVILMRNGKRVEIHRAAETPVSDGDEIAVFPPVAGG
jgi:molybdopterin synthase sulfur carrier subunit